MRTWLWDLYSNMLKCIEEELQQVNSLLYYIDIWRFKENEVDSSNQCINTTSMMTSTKGIYHIVTNSLASHRRSSNVMLKPLFKLPFWNSVIQWLGELHISLPKCSPAYNWSIHMWYNHLRPPVLHGDFSTQSHIYTSSISCSNFDYF